MGLEKIAIIMYVFSIGILFMAYYMNQVFQDPLLGGNGNVTFGCLHMLIGGPPVGPTANCWVSTLPGQTYQINSQINANLIFGDFLAALTVLFGILTGSALNSAFGLIPWANQSILLLQGLLFDLSSVFLWIFIVSNRKTD